MSDERPVRSGTREPVVIDGERFGGSDLLNEIEDIDRLRDVAKELRTYLHRERAYVQKLEHDVSMCRDVLESILWQQKLSITTARRMARVALAGFLVGPTWPGQKFIHPDQPTREALDA